MQQLRLIFHKGEHSTNVVCNSKRQQSNDNKQKQHSPKAQVFYKFLPCCSEAGQNSFSLLQVGVEERMAFHGTVKTEIKRSLKTEFGHQTLILIYLYQKQTKRWVTIGLENLSLIKPLFASDGNCVLPALQMFPWYFQQ